MKLIVFDLDRTLADLAKGVTKENIERLKRLEEKGASIAICSGKTVDYLCGFMRQLGLSHPILVGENGAVFQIGVDLPPKEFYIQKYSKAAKDTIRFLKESFDEIIEEPFYQMNQVVLTIFPKSELEFQVIRKCIQENVDKIQDVDIYEHVDSFDIVPVGINKKTGLEMLGDFLGISADDTIAVGDGINDYPMFEYAKLSLGVKVQEEERVSINYQSIDDVLEYLLQIIE